MGPPSPPGAVFARSPRSPLKQAGPAGKVAVFYFAANVWNGMILYWAAAVHREFRCHVAPNRGLLHFSCLRQTTLMPELSDKARDSGKLARGGRVGAGQDRLRGDFL